MQKSNLQKYINSHGDVIAEILPLYGLSGVAVTPKNLASAIVVHGQPLINDLNAISNFDDGTEDFLRKIRNTVKGKIKNSVIGKTVNKVIGKIPGSKSQLGLDVAPTFEPLPVQDEIIQTPKNKDVKQDRFSTPAPANNNVVVASTLPTYGELLGNTLNTASTQGGGGGGSVGGEEEQPAKKGFDFKKWLPAIIGGAVLVVGAIIYFATRKK